MSGDQHNQADPLDLDAILGRARALTYALGRDHIGAVASFGHTVGDEDVPALVAEVRRLRDTLAVVARHRCCRDCGATFEQCQRYRLGRAIKCCPDCHHAA